MAYKDRSILVEEHIPQFIRLDYPQFVEFIKLYYSQQDQVGEAYEFIANSLEYYDIDSTNLEYLENFSGQYLSSFPNNVVEGIDKRILIKNIRQFYESLGSEKSIQFLFKILFDEDVFLYYPSTDILRVSDGKWQDDFVIKISNNRKDLVIQDLVGTEIVGQTSGARGLVERIDVYEASNGFQIAECFLNNVSPINDYTNFLVDEYVTGTTLDGSTDIEERVYSIITDVAMTVNGLYNTPGDLLEIDSTGGVDAYVVVQSVEDGSIQNMEIIEAGTGYVIGETIDFTSTSGRGAKAKIDGIGGLGEITSIEMISEGYVYTSMPSYTINTSVGSGAILYPFSDTIGKIKKFEINNFGVNYRSSVGDSFPYQFPIYFTVSPTTTTFYTSMFVYDDSWNGIKYKINENITGETSGAQGTLKRVNQDTGIFSFSLVGETEFEDGELITGEATGAEGFAIYEIFETKGNIVPGPVGNYKGYFRNTDGYVSGDKYIQDSYYYQDFSYVITTLKNKEDWIEPIKDLIHPAGTIVFGFATQDDFIRSYSYGGWVSPILNTNELYKFDWQHHKYSEEEWTLWYPDILHPRRPIENTSNTSIASFANYKIYEIAHIRIQDYEEEYPDGIIDIDYTINTLRKTNKCFGSQLMIEYPDTGQSVLIDSLLNDLLIDSANTLLI